MRLCFGIFANVLNYCSKDEITQESLIARIVRCIDPTSNYIKNILDDEGLKKMEEKYGAEKAIEGDGSAICKILHCDRKFAFKEIIKIDHSAIVKVVKDFEKNVAPFIYENKKAQVILALLDIIRQDKTIDFENREYFEEYLGMDKQQLLEQREINFSDFLGRTLIYTIYSGIDNRVGKEYVKIITEDYINNFSKLYAHEYEWNKSTQALSLTFTAIYMLFVQALERYQITKFIPDIDPTDILDDIWLERCEDFLEDTKVNIWNVYVPIGSENLGITIRKVQEFTQTLDEYAKYLGINMRPLDDNHATFVPIYRDENTKWSFDFVAKVHDYRQRLLTIWQDLYIHMLFAQISDVHE